MSYARFSNDSNVYVYMDVNGSLACCGCILSDGPSYYASTDAMVEHLLDHRIAGHKVPMGLEGDLRADDHENFPPSCVDGHVWGEPFHPYPDKFPRLQRVRCGDCDWEASWHDGRADVPTREARV